MYYDYGYWHHGPSFGLVALLFYFLPTIVAFLRGHQSRFGIFLLNLFLGWSGIGWLIALIWSLSPLRYYYHPGWGPPPWARGRW